MKAIIVFTLFIVGISALPKLNTEIDFKNERLVTDAIASAIQDLSLAIREAGLDPYYVQDLTRINELPVEIILSITTVTQEFLFRGLSNIVINNLDFSILFSRLRFDISLPLIETTANNLAADITSFGGKYTASASGRLAINNVRVRGEVRVSIGIISGISIRSLDIDFNLGGIESALNVIVQNWNISNYLNTLLGTTIPQTLNDFSAEINELLEIIVREIADDLL